MKSRGLGDVYKRQEETGASTATISRVNRSLNYGEGGYDLVLEKLIEKDLKESKE